MTQSKAEWIYSTPELPRLSQKLHKVIYNKFRHNGRSYEYKKCYTNRSDRYSAITVAPISIIFLYKKERPLLTTTVAPSCIKNVILIGATVIVL